MRDELLRHLAELVGCNTENPPREIGAEHAIFAYINGVLPDEFIIDVTDHGDGHVAFLAVRGTPRVLFNVHLDTVPIGDGWTRPPLELTIEDDRAYGRGSCDIKGAAAALLTLARNSDAPMAMLFTTDEEGAHGCCVREYVSSIDASAWDLVVVAEPTLCKAVLGHRGYLSVIGKFSGEAGHSSEQRGLDDSAVHKAMNWGARAVTLARGADSCFNIGQIVGGVKSNVIANHAEVRWSARLAPGTDDQAFFEEMVAHAVDADWAVPFTGPPLPAIGQDRVAAAEKVAAYGWPGGEDVDFWTEASLFSGGGLPSVVLGPGNIAQAHTADEWVALDQLDLALARYREVMEHA